MIASILRVVHYQVSNCRIDNHAIIEMVSGARAEADTRGWSFGNNDYCSLHRKLFHDVELLVGNKNDLISIRQHI